jgi:hypothetical protein
MTDAFRKVKSGDPLNIPATAYNAMLDAAVANMRSQNKPSAIRGEQGVYVQVLNETGYPLEQFEILGVEGPVFHPRNQRDAFQQTPVLRGVVPKEKHKGKFVVLQEPAAPYTVVRACISGLTVARVYVPEPEEDKGYTEPKACDIEEGYTYDFTAGSSGGAAILWIEEGVGPKWALIRIGHGDTSAIFPVTLEKTGGEAGDHESQCDFIYDVYDFPDTSGSALAQDVDPNSDDLYRRTDLGKYKEANFGLALYDENNELKIAWCNEVMETKSCSSSDDKEKS